MRGVAVDEVVAALRKSVKYHHLCPETLSRVAAWAASRHASSKAAAKAAKRKLHQVYAAYLDAGSLNEVRRLVDGLAEKPSEDAIRATCRQVLEYHASTRERIPIMEDVFPRLLSSVGLVRTVLDLACGLAPFSLPWMDLAADVRYCACDIDLRIADTLNAFFARTGRPETALACDVLVSPPEIEADVVLLLKALPCLEQQEAGAAAALLKRLRARYAILSFPGKSLGGAEKGMAAHYARVMERLLGDLGLSAERIGFPSEIFYVVRLS